ncbi:glutathione S-transferase family protein [Sphingomonas profundi]|uniref:glutathione S-transferase family protein n=1 Tax=Alterirhizorhabdus profundi TaxID=2681549 RepID=UPI0012E8B40C|nr:glutathione S-transferase N-terminal domain-containing protein [Sphingomonas profundi]
MIDFYHFPSPNTWKVAIMLEECGLPYRVRIVDIAADQQFAPDFLAISPNNRVPAIVDHDAPGGPRSVFESGAILVYLAEKTGRFLAAEGPARTEAFEWLFWQHGGLGPMAGQAHHFARAAPPGNDYAAARYVAEAARLYGVLDRRLAGRAWIAGDYGVADIACWGWVWFHRMHGQSLADFPQVRRWFNAMAARPAVARGRAVGVADLSVERQAIYDGPYYAAADDPARDS